MLIVGISFINCHVERLVDMLIAFSLVFGLHAHVGMNVNDSSPFKVKGILLSLASLVLTLEELDMKTVLLYLVLLYLSRGNHLRPKRAAVCAISRMQRCSPEMPQCCSCNYPFFCLDLVLPSGHGPSICFWKGTTAQIAGLRFFPLFPSLRFSHQTKAQHRLDPGCFAPG